MKPPTDKPKLAKLAFEPKRYQADFYFRYADEDTGKRVFQLYEKRTHSARPARLTHVLVLPADAASVEALVEKITDAIYKQYGSVYKNKDKYPRDSYRAYARAVLKSLGFKTGGRK